MKPAGGWSAVIGTAIALASLTYVIGYNVGSNSADTQLEAVEVQRDQLQQELESTPEPTPSVAVAEERPSPQASPTPDEEVALASPSPRASSRGTSPTWLSDLEPVDYQYSFDVGAADVNASSYANSVWTGFLGGGNEAWYEYNLGRRYGMLEAVVGLQDESVAEAEAQFEVFVDGESRFVTRLGLGQSEDLEVPVDGALRVRLVVTGLEGSGRFWPTWGNAAVLPP